MSNLDLGVIGNGAYSALIDRKARVVWACFPRLDGDPVFCSLLDPVGANAERGSFEIELLDFSHSEQRYLPNTAILVTVLHDKNGGAIEITDFAPRFKQFERLYRPLLLVRYVRPKAGDPRIRVRLRPTFGYGASRPEITRGSNHIRYVGDGQTMRLTTDAPPVYIIDELPFVAERPFTLMLGPDESLTSSIDRTSKDFFQSTHDYWREWTRYLSIPFEWQDEVIRAAITLKLCSFEETGAIVAALTTSIPEAKDSGRNWDYRFCWLRDAFFVVHALNRLGATKTMEQFIYYITDVIASAADGNLQPVYGIAAEARIPEKKIKSLAGYRGMGPVRVGNQAFEQIQNDSYGAVILAITQIFFDRRLERAGSMELFERLERLGAKAVELYNKPDAGLWELRRTQQVHTFSSMMCWAACDRLAKIASRLCQEAKASHWRTAADRIRKEIWDKAWNARRRTFVDSFGGEELDAALLLMNQLGFTTADDPRFLGTVEAIGKSLKRGLYVFRYANDDFGEPENAFNICTFWYIDALAAIGRGEEARAMFENMLAHRNHLGLLSEHLAPETGELWGNFPQTYSMVGLISSAMRLSRNWEEAF